jgi:hypothetical protein
MVAVHSPERGLADRTVRRMGGDTKQLARLRIERIRHHGEQD